MNEEKGKALQGRSTKEIEVQQWRYEHPTGSKADCIRDTGLSRPTVKKYWNNIEQYSTILQQAEK